MTTAKIKIMASRDLDKLSTETWEIWELTFSERAVSATKISGLMILAGIPCIFIPLANHVLVPGALLASGYFGYTTMLNKVGAHGQNFTCPVCKEKTTTEKLEFNWPLTDYCAHCKERLVFEIA